MSINKANAGGVSAVILFNGERYCFIITFLFELFTYFDDILLKWRIILYICSLIGLYLR